VKKSKEKITVFWFEWSKTVHFHGGNNVHQTITGGYGSVSWCRGMRWRVKANADKRIPRAPDEGEDPKRHLTTKIQQSAGPNDINKPMVPINQRPW
jgi:hypothetical protein